MYGTEEWWFCFKFRFLCNQVYESNVHTKRSKKKYVHDCYHLRIVTELVIDLILVFVINNSNIPVLVMKINWTQASLWIKNATSLFWVSVVCLQSRQFDISSAICYPNFRFLGLDRFLIISTVATSWPTIWLTYFL